MRRIAGIKQGELIAIRWDDSRTKAGWVELNEDVPLGDITTVGFVMSNDSNKLTLTSSNTKQAHDKDKVYGLTPVSVPWASITMVTRTI